MANVNQRNHPQILPSVQSACHKDMVMRLTACIQPRATVAFFRLQKQQQQWKSCSTGKQPILNDMSEK
jgi:hypothetical protein